MVKKLLIVFFFFASFFTKAQCPQAFDYLGNLSSTPKWISCTGSPNYLLNFQSNVSWGPYTINWGDGSPNQNAASYSALSNITHNYTTTGTDTFVVSLMIPSLSCTLTGLVVMEKPVNASIQIPIGGVTQACAPATLQFINSSTDVSATTTFTWNFGDGSPNAVFSYTNGGQTISHTYSVGTVNCQTAVTLMAMNYCSFGNPTSANFNPIQIYDRDVAAITPDAFIKCLPNTSFTFTNTTTRNCLAQGNTFQRQEEWNFGDYWGRGYDSIIPWSPWPPTTPQTINYPGIGTYSVVLRDSNLCGVSTTTINVSIISAPVANFNVPPNPLCQNAPITFTNTSTTGYFYKWDFGVGAGYVNTSYAPQTFTYTTPGTYTVMNVVYFGTGCSDTAKQVITILPAPTASFVLTPTVGCNTLTAVSFTDASTSATGWNWNFGNGNTSASQTPPAQTYTTIGNSVITLTVTAANLCRNIKTATVTVFQSPVAAFSPTSSCVGSVVTFTDMSTAAATNTITTWNWNFGDGSPTTGLQNPVHTYTAIGNYTVTLIVNSAVCSNTLSQNFVVNVKPTAAFTLSPLSGCPTLTVNFTNSSANATSFLWDFGVATSTSNATNPSFTYSNTSGTAINPTISLIALTGAGCSDTAVQSITVFPEPVASFTVNTTPGCSPLALTFTNTSTGAINYNWDFGDGNTSVLPGPVHTFTNATLFAQTFTVQLVATNSDGCTDTTTQLITINPKPLFTFTMIPASGCTPLAVNFPAVLGVTSYTWDFGDSFTSGSINPTHTYTNSTASTIIYTVTLIASNAFGCIDTAYGMPVIYPKPIADFNVTPNNGCSPLATNFTNLSTLNATNNWDFDDGNLSTAVNPVHTFTTNNTLSNIVYGVQLLVVSSDGCRDSVTKPVTILPLPQANFSLDTPACSPKQLTFTNLSQGANAYNWNFGNSNTSTATNPQQQYINNSGINQTYTVQLIATNAVNCKDTIEVPIIVHSQPNYNVVPSPTAGCAPLAVNFPTVVGATNYNWNFGDGNTATGAPASHVFVNVTTANVTYTVQMVASDANSCADTAFALVTIYPQPVANFQVSPTTVNIPDDPIHCTNLSTGNIASNYWTFGDGTGTSTETNPDYDYTTEGEYVVTLIVTSDKGCKDTFELPTKIIVFEAASIQIPNAFTPNLLGSPGTTFSSNDLNNDIFHPVIKGVDKERYELTIYSRWGELLFMTKETTEGWDGYYKGKVCTQDVYVWKLKAITLDGKIINKTGDVLLLK